MSVAKRHVEDWRKGAVALWERALAAAREGRVMKGKDPTELVETFNAVVCEQVGLCVGCARPVQFALHIDVGAVDTTFFVCADCLAVALGRMIILQHKCGLEVVDDAGHEQQAGVHDNRPA